MSWRVVGSPLLPHRCGTVPDVSYRLIIETPVCRHYMETAKSFSETMATCIQWIVWTQPAQRWMTFLPAVPGLVVLQLPVSIFPLS